MDDDVSPDSRDTRINALAGSPKEAEQGSLRRTETRDSEITALVKLLEERLPLAPLGSAVNWPALTRKLSPTEVISEQRTYINQLEWGIGIFGFLFLMMLLARR
jgi:hypothetical protein